MKPEELAQLIGKGGPYQVSTEALMQSGVREVLLAADIDFHEEYRLTPKDRLDFFVDGICVELKVKGRPSAIVRQLKRYAAHEDVRSLILVTNKMIECPWKLEEKEVFIVNVGRQWL